MLATRTAWFEECGGPPIGNKCESPASAGDCRAWLACWPARLLGAKRLGMHGTTLHGTPPFCLCAMSCMQLLICVLNTFAVALERTAWQQPVSAGAISDRGKQAVGAPA